MQLANASSVLVWWSSKIRKCTKDLAVVSQERCVGHAGKLVSTQDMAFRHAQVFNLAMGTSEQIRRVAPNRLVYGKFCRQDGETPLDTLRAHAALPVRHGNRAYICAADGAGDQVRTSVAAKCLDNINFGFPYIRIADFDR